MKAQFNSQCGEDRWVVENVILPETGTYIEVGSAHPVINSNSKYFDDIGWRGLCIDADPHWAGEYPKHRSERTIFENVAVAFEKGVRRFEVSPIHEISRLSDSGNIEIQAYPLWMLQEKYELWADILFVDVEGFEYEVLNGYNYTYMPRVIMFEHTTCGVRDETARHLMDEDPFYELAHETEYNYIYVLSGFLKK